YGVRKPRLHRLSEAARPRVLFYRAERGIHAAPGGRHRAVRLVEVHIHPAFCGGPVCCRALALLLMGPSCTTSHIPIRQNIHTTCLSDILSDESCITAPVMLHKYYERPGGLPMRDRHQAREVRCSRCIRYWTSLNSRGCAKHGAITTD